MWVMRGFVFRPPPSVPMSVSVSVSLFLRAGFSSLLVSSAFF